jgi:hypothetical protein
LGETFLDFGQGLICRYLGGFVGHALDKPWVSNPLVLRRLVRAQTCTKTTTLPSTNTIERLYKKKDTRKEVVMKSIEIMHEEEDYFEFLGKQRKLSKA